MGRRIGHGGLNRGTRAGAAAILLAIALGAVDIRLAAAPLTLFILFCFAAPFLPAVGFFLPVVTRGTAPAGGVALTFDDGPDPRTTPVLLERLERYGVCATFFVTGQRAAAYPQLVEAIRQGGHDVGNHSYTHDMLLMLRGARTLSLEIDRTREVLARLGIDSRAFRPPAAVVGPHLGPALDRRGMFAVTYSCRALDGGNRWVRGISRRVLRRVRAGDIIMLHDVMPPDAGGLPLWLREVEDLLNGLAGRRLAVRPLREIIGRAVTAIPENSFSLAGPKHGDCR